jgi:hypothetical protein
LCALPDFYAVLALAAAMLIARYCTKAAQKALCVAYPILSGNPVYKEQVRHTLTRLFTFKSNSAMIVYETSAAN